MAYSTQTNITDTELTTEELIQLTDDEDTGSVNSGRVTAAISKADTEIDGYLQGRYTVPLTTVPDEIKFISATIAAYYLSRRRQQVTESILDKYRKALARLKAIAEGKFSLLGITAKTDTAIESTTKDDRHEFTRSKYDTDGNRVSTGSMHTW